MFIQVNIKYPQKIDCSKGEMKKELKEAFGVLGKLWLTEINAAKFEKRQTDQLKTFQKFWSNHVLQYQNTSLLVQAMLCTAANTSPVVRDYTILQMVTPKRRNRITSENLEVLFLLERYQLKIQRTMKMKENALKRRNEQLITFYLV